MERKPHPNHALKTRWMAIGLFLLTLLSWGVGYYSERYLSNKKLLSYSIFFFVIFMICMFLMLALRALICRCPKCKKWLIKQEKVNIDHETRKFICEKCNIIWDSKVQLSYGEPT